MLWLIDGSGGESHLGISCCNWFPAKTIEPAHLGAMSTQIEHYARFTSSMSIATCCMTTLACFPSRHIEAKYVPLVTDRIQMRTINDHGHFVVDASHSIVDIMRDL